MKVLNNLLCASLLTCLSITEATGAQWRKYESENFIVYSDYSEKNVLKRIRSFEMFKASVHKLLSIPESTEVVPFEIYLFRNKWTLREFTKAYAMPYSVQGFYHDRLGYPLMVVGPSTENEIFFHEYIHFLNSRRSNIFYPSWYEEGMAEFYSTLEIRDGTAIIGRVPEVCRGVPNYFPMLPIDRLAGPEASPGGPDSWRFYATAWLLAHRVFLGARNGLDDYSQPIKRYLDRYARGEKEADVLFEELGLGPREIYSDLRRYYARKGRWRGIAMSVPDIQGKVDITELDLTDVINVKVRLAVAVDGWEYAGELLRKHEDSIDGEGRAVLAIIAGHDSATVGAEEKLIEHLMGDPSLSGAGHAYLGHALFDLAEKKAENGNDLLTEAVRHLEIAREQNALYGASDLLAEAYWKLGRKQAATGEITRILELNPLSVRANLLAGEYSMKAGLEEDARLFLNRVINWAHSEDDAEKAVELLAELDGKRS